jgi:hypothetical protein
MPPALVRSVSYLNEYAQKFAHRQATDPNKIQVSYKYYPAYPAEAEIYDRVMALGGDLEEIDTVLEFALATYYSPSVVSIRPPDATELLPANNRNSALKLSLAVYKELVEIKFLDSNNRNAIGRYEGVLKFISDNSGISRADIEAYFRQGIGALVAETVDAEFNKISFPLYRYNAILTRTTGNQYILSYKDVNDVVKELPPASLETLLATMRRTSGFETSDVDTVNAQAALIPAAVYARWQRELGIINGLDTLKNALTDFYLAPTQANYNILLGIYAKNRAVELGNQGNALFQRTVINRLVTTLSSLNNGLAEKVTGDMQRVNIRNTAAALTDAKYQAFSTPFGVGGGRD